MTDPHASKRAQRRQRGKAAAALRLQAARRACGAPALGRQAPRAPVAAVPAIVPSLPRVPSTTRAEPIAAPTPARSLPARRQPVYERVRLELGGGVTRPAARPLPAPRRATGEAAVADTPGSIARAPIDFAQRAEALRRARSRESLRRAAAILVAPLLLSTLYLFPRTDTRPPGRSPEIAVVTPPVQPAAPEPPALTPQPAPIEPVERAEVPPPVRSLPEPPRDVAAVAVPSPPDAALPSDHPRTTRAPSSIDLSALVPPDSHLPREGVRPAAVAGLSEGHRAEVPAPEPAGVVAALLAIPLPQPTPLPKVEPEAEAPFGARLVAAAMRQTLIEGRYDHRYVRIAYPMGDVPADTGVCSDVLVRAYRGVGIDLQQLVHEARLGSGDASVDHRRVQVLKRFFERFGTSLPVSPFPESYKPGDIVAYDVPWGRTSKWHIAIVSDTIAPTRRPMVIHNRGYGAKLEDALFHKRIIGHYRFEGMAAVARKPAPAEAAQASGEVKPTAGTPARRLVRVVSRAGT